MTSTEKLLQFKPYLDLGTNEGLRYDDETKSRYESFKICIEHLQNSLTELSNQVIVELGTCRSYVDGKYEGCNSDDFKYWDVNNHEKWDWGAGCFSLVMRLCLPKISILTVDIVKSHLERAYQMHGSLYVKAGEIDICPDPEPKRLPLLGKTNEYGITGFALNDSVKLLGGFAGARVKPSLIYLDTGDMWPIKPTCELQLAEAKAIVQNDVLAPGGLLLIDDVLNGTPHEQGDHTNTLGKSELAIPYLLANGFEIIFKGYQYILKKK